MTDGIRSELKSVIRDAIWNEDKNQVLTEEKIAGLSEFYVSHFESLMRKYIRGQEEHGGNLSDRDCVKELYAEVLDLTHYIGEVMRTNGIPASSVTPHP